MSNQLQNILDEIKVEKDSKLLPENIKKGVQIFDITGTLEQGEASADAPVKLFETIDEMQADPDANEGDLALVYRSEIQNSKVDSKFNSAAFPNTVVLPEAITDYVDVMYRATDTSVMFDCMGQLDSSMFMIDCYTDSGSIRIQYESSDGITYTRTDGGEELVDFGTEIYYAYPDYWNDAIGYFIQVGGSVFDGLYQNQLDKANIQFMNINAIKVNVSDDKSSVTLSIDEMDKNATYFNKTELIAFCERHNISLGGATFYLDSSNNLCYSPALGILYDFSGNFLGYTLNGNWSNASTNFYKLDFDNDLVTNLPSLSATNVWYAYNTTTQKYYLDKDSLDCTTIPTYISEGSSNKYSGSVMVASTSTSDFTSLKYASYDYNYQGLGTVYLIADSQFNLINSNELLPEKVAYGKNGIITGDGSVYNILDTKRLLSLLGLNELYNASQYFSSFNITTEKNKLYSVVKDDTSKYVFNYPYSMKEYPGFGFSYYLQDLLSLQYCTVTAVFSLNDYYTCIVAVVSSTTTTVSAGGADLIYAILDSDFNIIKTEKIIENQAAPSPSSVGYRICYADTSCYIVMESPFNGRQDIIIKFDMITKTYIGYNLHDEYTSDASSSSLIAVFHNDYLYVARHIYVNSTGIYYLYIKKFNANLELVDTISYTNSTLKDISVNAFAILGDNLYIRTTGYSSKVYYNCIFKVENPISTFVIDTTSTSQFSGILSDGEYLYVPCTGGTKKYDANLALIETLPIQTKCLSNAQYYNFEFVDYANYTCESFQRRMSIVNGKEAATNYYDPSNPFMDTKLADDSKIMSCEHMNSDTKFIQKYEMGESGSSKMVMLTLLPKVNAKFEEGLNENAYMVGISDGTRIYYTGKFNGNIMSDYTGMKSPAEYNTALNTVDEILGEEA